MTAIFKAIEAVKEDVNKDESLILSIFERVTSGLFKGVLLLGVPLITYMILFL